MTSIASWLWGASQLDDAVDKATSELLPAGAEDIALNLEICDQIRSKSVPAKDAMRALKRRLNHKNPNVQNLALSLTDTCVKNGGDVFLIEIASREFMDNLVSILKIPALNMEVKNNILRMIQNWNFAFEGKATLHYVGQVYKTLLSEGFKFPPKDLANANTAMVDTQTAPEWIDSDVCLRCRTPFTFTNRKHHCRNCGQVFDQACSSKSMPLPHFGITQDVRVCDSCYNKLTRKADKVDKVHRHSTNAPAPRHRSAQELADAELQRAIQLSLEEAGSSGHPRPGYVPYQPVPWQYSEPPIVDHKSRPALSSSTQVEEDDPDLKAAIEASLREMNAPKPSAPVVTESSGVESSYPSQLVYSQPAIPAVPAPSIPSYDLEPLESDAILTFSQTIEQVEAQGGRDLSRYPAVNELYDKANHLRPKLALSLDDAGRKTEMLSDMHDKLSQAVKLYDQLLSEQIANPRWRSTQAPVSQRVTPAYATTNGYSQWASASTYQPQQWQEQPPHTSTSLPAQAPALESQQHRPSYVEQTQVYQPQVPLTVQSPSLPPVSLNPQQYQYSAPSPATISTQFAPSPTSPPSSGLNRSKTVSFAAPPPPGLNVGNVPPPTVNGHLSRSNTVATRSTLGHSQSWAASRHHQSQTQLQQLQQQQAHLQQQLMQAPAPPTNVIPIQEFPVVPSEVPHVHEHPHQQHAMYGPGLVPQGERKEAMLIDL